MNPYLKWILLAPANVLSTLVGYALAPVLPAFASEDGWLPSWLSWFQTPDNSLDGDGGWQREHMQWRFKLPPQVARYVGRVGWLLRNECYGFGIDVMGAKCKATDALGVYGDPAVSDSPAHSGVLRRELYRGDELIYWQWYFVFQYSETRCLRINLGWKLWGLDGTDKNCQFVLYVNPFKTARKK